jgi:hypothetical protein
MKLRGKGFLLRKILFLQPSIEAGPVVQWIEYLPAGRQGSFLKERVLKKIGPVVQWIE